MHTREDINPRIYQERGFFKYEDGLVHGELEIAGTSLTICDWYSAQEGNGNTVKALTWIRDQGFEEIRVVDATTKAIPYWRHLLRKGLVNSVRDEQGNQLHNV